MFAARILAAASLLVVGAAQSEVIFTATLTPGQEPQGTTISTSTGAARAPPFGTAEFTLNDDMTAISMRISITGIDITGTQTADTFDNLVAAHIHAPALGGSNGQVAWGFIGAPSNNNNPNDGTLMPFVTGTGGTFTGVWNLNEGNNTSLIEQLPNLLNGLAYVNFHTVQNPGGEIRGQITQIPEPGTTGLVLLGLVAVGAVASRRRGGHCYEG